MTNDNGKTYQHMFDESGANHSSVTKRTMTYPIPEVTDETKILLGASSYNAKLTIYSIKIYL